MKGFTLVSLALVGLSSTALSQERIVPKSTENAKGCDFKYGYAYDINLGNRIWVDWDNDNSGWFPVMNFTYQVWIKPHVLSSDRTQQVVGSVYSTSYMYYNHGIIIDNDYIYLRAGENTMDMLANALGYNLRPHLFKWVHVTATYEETDTEQIGKLYINGKLVNISHTMGVGSKLDASIYIGSTKEPLHYTGLADEIRFFSRVLTDNEIEDTWNRTLTSEEIEKDNSLLFYFNADGERRNEPKDKSKYNRAAKWVTESDSGHLANRTNVVANCMGCFDSDMPGFCVPSAINTGHCGDGIVMGDEECDGGEGCGEDCKCEENYTAHGLPYCKEYYFNKTQGEYNMSDECIVTTAINKCLPAMNPIECDCECFKVKGIDCLLSENCDADTIGFKLYTTWGACLSRCPKNDYCYDLIPDYCARFRTAESCQDKSRTNIECTWCDNTCVSMKTSCPSVLENDITNGSFALGPRSSIILSIVFMISFIFLL